MAILRRRRFRWRSMPVYVADAFIEVKLSCSKAWAVVLPGVRSYSRFNFAALLHLSFFILFVPLRRLNR